MMAGDCLSEEDHLKPLDLFREKDVVRMCAPMVRYSKYDVMYMHGIVLV